MKDLTTMFDHPAKFLCDWDHGNITEIHTLDSLYRHYLTSNLFDSDLSWHRYSGSRLIEVSNIQDVIFDLLQVKSNNRWTMAHFMNRDADKKITKVEILDYCQMLTDAGIIPDVPSDDGDINGYLLDALSDVMDDCFRGSSSADEKVARTITESDIRFLAEKALFHIAWGSSEDPDEVICASDDMTIERIL
jgi:hypothetical protein